MRRHLSRALLAALLASVLGSTAAAAATVAQPREPRFGAYAWPAPYAGWEPLGDLEHALGRRIDIVLWYHHWSGGATEPRLDWLEAVRRSGRTPLLTWEPWHAAGGPLQPRFRLRAVAGGAFDDYIVRWAEALRSFRTPVFLRPMHEMNGDWYPWGGVVNGNSPSDYVAAWRHIHRLFRRAGAANVRFVWAPLADDTPWWNRFEAYYPGSAYVDVLGLDGYNWGRTDGWRSFDAIFAAPYRRLARLGPQPIWITETGSAPEGGDKAAWVRDMWLSTRRYPRLRAIVWFNKTIERDWRASAPAEVAAAFAAPRTGCRSRTGARGSDARVRCF